MKKWMSWLLVGVFLVLSPSGALAKLAPGDYIDTRGHWAEEDIQTTVDRGLMNGMGTNQQGFKVFAPEGTVNRAQLGVTLERCFNLDYGNVRFVKEPAASDYYWDLEDEGWYAEAVIVGALNNIFDSGKEFKPTEVVSRIEVARSLFRSFRAKNISVPMVMMMPYFEDTKGLCTEDINAITFVNNTGIMQGNNHSFRPQDPVKRGEMAKILNRCYQLVEANPPEEDDTSSTVQINIKKVESKSDVLEIDLNTPVFEVLENKAFQEKLNERLNKDAFELITSLKAVAVEEKQNLGEEGFPFHRFVVMTRCGPYHVDGEVLSFYVDYYTYSGGAHGITERVAYNFNMKTGEELALEDFFAKDVDYKAYVNEAIQQEISTRPDDFFAGDMGFQGINDEQAFYVQNGSLVVYFQQYEIACYAAGIQEFRIAIP
ncbi:MAG: DUF3298 and DUF4163 domain-containing protein [Bacillota bacterium]|nr:DUF3298 and DUF4163 domain-containing protein [Bacillota bacterium]